MVNKKKLLILFTNMTLFLFIMVFSLLIFELSFRYIAYKKDIDFRLYLKEFKNSDRLPENLFTQDPILGYKLKPDTQTLALTSDFSVLYRINSNGLRDKEYSHDPDENKIRFLAFGDSFTFGEGVDYEKRFTDIPEAEIPNIEVINFGIPGYGLDQEFIYYLKEGIKYNPDYVIIFINNIQTERMNLDIVKNNELVLDNVNFNLTNTPSTLYVERDKLVKPQLIDNLYLLSYMRYKYELIKYQNQREDYDKALWGDMFNRYKNPSENTNIDLSIERSRLILNEFSNEIKKNNSTLIIINIDTSSRRLSMISNNTSVFYYDLSTELNQEKEKYNLRFKYDFHYNEKTHEFIGKEFKKIINKLIL